MGDAKAELAPAPAGAKAAIGIGSAAITAALYLATNHLYRAPPTTLFWTALDAAVPFLPLSLWVYLTDYFLVFSAFMQLGPWRDVKRFMRAYYVLLAVGAVVHFLWPTTFPRENFPITEAHGFTGRTFVFIRALDSPASCLPSLHVASSYLGALGLWRHPRPLFIIWLAWATLVALSTLTAKQHYVIDIVAGLLLALACWASFMWAPARADQGMG